jgi:hypothetical protein
MVESLGTREATCEFPICGEMIGCQNEVLLKRDFQW